ncbi:MAG TPA: hypothetical protein VNZ45_13600 [Bacteroidia bacterium]|nr:hypothetical protein [Bacteroidia bacterium]
MNGHGGSRVGSGRPSPAINAPPKYVDIDALRAMECRNAIWKDLYNSGLTLQQIATKYDVTPSAVHRGIAKRLQELIK